MQRLAARSGARIHHAHPRLHFEQRRDLLRANILHLEESFAKRHRAENILRPAQPQRVRRTRHRLRGKSLQPQFHAQFVRRGAQRVCTEKKISLRVQRVRHRGPRGADFLRAPLPQPVWKTRANRRSPARMLSPHRSKCAPDGLLGWIIEISAVPFPRAKPPPAPPAHRLADRRDKFAAHPRRPSAMRAQRLLDHFVRAVALGKNHAQCRNSLVGNHSDTISGPCLRRNVGDFGKHD